MLRISSCGSLSGLIPGYVPWTDSAMSPEVIALLCNDVILNSRENVLEFGSGLSTVFLAAAVRQLGSGHVYSVENDSRWIEKVSCFLRANDLVKYVSFIHSPVAQWPSTDRSLSGVRWYEAEALAENLSEKTFDQIVVDGPIAYKRPIQMSRYPVVPFIYEHQLMSERFLLLLDDARRPGERRVLRKWVRDFGLNFQMVPKLGVAIATGGTSYNVV